MKSAEVFDTKRNVCWNLPDIKKQRFGCATMTLDESKVILIGGRGDDDGEKVHALVEVLECFATIENVDKCIEQEKEA